MHLGLGLYRHQLTEDNFAFAEQLGCSHLIIHLANYYSKEIVTATDGEKNYGIAKTEDCVWSEEYLKNIVSMAVAHGLTIAGIENFNPADWYDVLLAGPKRDQQIAHLKQIIRTVGKVGIRSFGYNFSLAGVWGHLKGPHARGGARTVYFDTEELKDIDTPIPNGQVWNMTYDSNAVPGYLPTITHDELWARLKYFLDEVLPVAQESCVDLALHPDDPPMPTLRCTPRLVYQPWMYQKLIDMNPNPANKIELCMGSLQEMTEGDLYDSLEQYARQGRIGYVHFRNVRGKVPRYDEVFIDEGDIDMLKALRILQRSGFDGVLIPDHTPLITGGGEPWHVGMAFAIGYMKAALTAIGEKCNAGMEK